MNDTPNDTPAEPPAQGSSAARSGATLSSDLSDCLKDLSIAVHQHGMYPPGHPSLDPAAERVTSHLTRLLKERSTLSLGAATDQLVIEGVATDSHNPLLRELARLLHRHHLGAISFQRGVSKDEIVQFLNLVAEDPDRTDDPLGLGPPERREQQPNIRLHPVAYDSLRLVEDDGTVADEDEAGRAARTRYARLWVGLARAAVLRGRGESSSGEPSSGEADAMSSTRSRCSWTKGSCRPLTR